ncbi:LLM class oxidoreductase [Peribacillus simplex]|uniref:F420-dependent hydroxymycolic acid dehydrogenase n=1 Tax=Peribacillus simplex TaxID=1478 RepID=A0A9W4LCT4_9BACI|nr:LLM class oxidoreductase [Peribacillus simplex]CAH0315023.1 F420-dependent hydroxymycolic acid dehydrogenase [Peribacillus simplex]
MSNQFENHRGYNQMFKENELTLGLLFPLESYKGDIPKMDIAEQMSLAKKAENFKFASLFVRDVPLRDPWFGDVGQIYDPFVFLGYLAAHTEKIALGTSSILLTLRHPLHVAKAAASVDKLSGERLVLGIATGDRPIEFPAFKVDPLEKADRFQESVMTMRKVWGEQFPHIDSQRVHMAEGDLLPKPTSNNIPLLVTGHSSQSVEWIVEHGDGWIYYPRNVNQQLDRIQTWRSSTNEFKPFVQSLYVDLTEDPNQPPTPIHLGFRIGRNTLIEYIEHLKLTGVNHIIIVLKNSKRPASEVIQELGEEVVPFFPSLIR